MALAIAYFIGYAVWTLVVWFAVEASGPEEGVPWYAMMFTFYAACLIWPILTLAYMFGHVLDHAGERVRQR